MSVLEAMAHGIPAIATAVGGVPQVIEDGVSGFLIDVDDEVTLSESLASLLAEPELREELGRSGRDRVVRNFGLDRTVGQVAGIYGALMLGKGTFCE